MNKILLFIILFFSIIANAQVTIYGNWRIDNVMGNRDVKEYSMVPQDANNRWGYLLTLNLDGTFVSRNLPPCGNDISLSTNGNFIVIDESHIRFVVKSKSSTSFNEASNILSDLNRDLGIFYIYKDSKSVRLISSNGILEDDKNKIEYNNLMDAFNWKSYDFIWNYTKGENPEEIVKDCIDHKNNQKISDCKVVLSKKENYGQIFLVRENANYHFLIYDDFNKKVSLAYPR